jgi:hypothetical protein
MTRLAAWSITALLAGCGAEIPSSPTYFADVQPLLRANCTRCHGADPSDPKIAKFRLDRYVQGDTITFDAWDYAQGTAGDAAPMIRVAVDQDTPAMPPDYSLTDRQRDILARWVDQGAPKGTRDNHLPEIELIAPASIEVVDQTFELTLRAWDTDLDGLVVQLWAHDLAGGGALEIPLGDPTGSGQRDITLDTGTLASKHDFELYVVLDDGYSDDPALNRTRLTLIDRLPVDHGLRGTAPTVKLLTPNGGDTLIGTVPITWSATDPDAGDSLTIALDLLAVAGDGTTSVAASISSGLANTGSFDWTIPSSVATTDAQGQPQLYKVRVTATDTLGMPRNVRSDDSDTTVTIARATTTTYTWDDVRPLFATYCGKCHEQPARIISLEYFRTDKYDASDAVDPINSDQGVFETKALIYQRAVATTQMPPGAEPKPSAADREKIGNWILGGAPRGGGPANARPTFTWMSPTMTDTSPPVIVTWSSADTEGLASGKLEYAKLNGNAASGCTTMNTTMATWTTIPDPKASVMLMGALTWADSFDWTPPATVTGYYCVRGVVTDEANQSTTVLNAFGVK